MTKKDFEKTLNRYVIGLGGDKKDAFEFLMDIIQTKQHGFIEIFGLINKYWKIGDYKWKGKRRTFASVVWLKLTKEQRDKVRNHKP